MQVSSPKVILPDDVVRQMRDCGLPTDDDVFRGHRDEKTIERHIQGLLADVKEHGIEHALLNIQFPKLRTLALQEKAEREQKPLQEQAAKHTLRGEKPSIFGEGVRRTSLDGSIENMLAKACKYGFVTLIKKIFEEFPALAQPHRDGFELISHGPKYTLLTIAAIADRPEVIQTLHDLRCADFTYLNGGVNAVARATRYRSKNALAKFLQLGVSPKEILLELVSSTDIKSTPEKDRACVNLVLDQDSKSITDLLDHKSDNGTTILLQAAGSGAGAMLAVLLSRGAKLEYANVAVFDEAEKVNPILLACERAHDYNKCPYGEHDYNLCVVVLLRAVFTNAKYEFLLDEAREKQEILHDSFIKTQLDCYDAACKMREGYEKHKASSRVELLIQLINANYGFFNRDAFAFKVRDELTRGILLYQDDTVLLAYFDDTLGRDEAFTKRAANDPLRMMVFYCAALAQAPKKAVGLEMSASLGQQAVAEHRV